ncbi:hypothetical protein PRK78_002277 [Emydomyces testavorans]|uniref:Uncharacterized protein n=1 Tax=Emydomyces testavorans TaxID=2070801 RepID=A0AAF0DE14_9EURO|nr:hypothetical protein PRK78_002277 [Emydomyces testavorans]
MSDKILPPLKQATGPAFAHPQDRPGMAGWRDRSNRKRRLQATLQLNDTELVEVLHKMWEDPDAQGKLSNHPEFVHRFVPTTFENTNVHLEEAARVLHDCVKKEIIQCLRRFGAPGLTGILSHRYSTRYPKRFQFCFMWYGNKPTLPPLLAELPNIVLCEDKVDPASKKPEI